MVIAQKSMTVQVVWPRRPIWLGTPLGVTVTIGTCWTICCCAVWVIEPLIKSIRVWPQHAVLHMLHVHSFNAVPSFVVRRSSCKCGRAGCGTDWCDPVVSLKRRACGTRRKLEHRSRRI